MLDRASLGLVAAALVCSIGCTFPVWNGWYWTYDVLRPFVRPREIAQQWLLGHLLPVWTTTGYEGFGSASLILYHKLFFNLAALMVLVGLPIGRALLAALVAFMVLGFLATAHAVRVALAGRHLMIEASCGAVAISCNFATSEWLIRGDFAEFAAQMLLPILFVWCFRLIRHGTFSWSVGPVMALIALAHSGTATYCLLPLGCALAVAVWRWPDRIVAWLRPAATGIALFCLILLPIALPAVPMARHSALEWLGVISPGARHEAMWRFFLPPKPRTTWPPPEVIQIDPLLVVALAAAIPIAILAIRRGRDDPAARAPICAFLVATVAVVLALQTRQALPLYDLLPGLAYIQFSWRLLTFSSVALVLIVGVVLQALEASRLRRLVPLVCAGMVLSTLPNKFEPGRYHDPRLAPSLIDGPDLGGGDAPEYTPRRPGRPLSFATATDLFRLPHAPSRCRPHWRTDMRRERARAFLDVTCAGAGSSSLPLFLAPGMRFEVAGRRVHPWRTCADPRPHLALPDGTTRIEVRFPTWWSVVTGGTPSLPDCATAPPSSGPDGLSS